MKPTEHEGGLQRRVDELNMNPLAQFKQTEELVGEQRRQLTMSQDTLWQLPFTIE